MKEFIISEAQKIFLNAIKRYAKLRNKELWEISIMLFLQEMEDEYVAAYKLLVDNVPEKNLTINEILNVKYFDIKGYSLVVPPHIANFLNNFRQEYQSNNIDVCVLINRNDEDALHFILYNNGKAIKEVFLNDLIKD